MSFAPRSLPPLLDLHPPQDDLRSDVLAGLSGSPKALPCKYFYDAYGSKLFEKICELPEYYPTRTELGILETNIEEITAELGPRVLLVEPGSGSSAKTRLLLDRLEECVAYVPIEISRTRLVASARELRALYPDLEVLPVCADFTAELEIPEPSSPPRRRVWFFPGSTIGNFEESQARQLLGRMASSSSAGDQLLIGVDLRKDPRKLLRAYDDAAGVTAAFNKNLLRRINRELSANFDLDSFEHVAKWNEERGRIEMYLRSVKDQTVIIDAVPVRFAAGETVFTESSHKYTIEQFGQIARAAGYEYRSHWCDSENLFSVQLYQLPG